MKIAQRPDQHTGISTPYRVVNIEVLWDGTYGLSSLSEKTRKSNRLQTSLQRQHFLLSYLKTLSDIISGDQRQQSTLVSEQKSHQNDKIQGAFVQVLPFDINLLFTFQLTK